MHGSKTAPSPHVIQYQDDITELNEMAKHRPRSTLVMGIAQENRQIRELQQEKQELQMTLEEHQSALQLIMHKYRQHTVHLLHANRLDSTLAQHHVRSKVRGIQYDTIRCISLYYLFQEIKLRRVVGVCVCECECI